MDWKLEVVTIPVSDMDRARAFYAERIGFRVDLVGVVFFRDPDGNQWMVQQIPPREPS